MTADVTAAMARLRKLVTDAKPALMDDPAWSAQFFRVDDDLALVAQALAEREGHIATLAKALAGVQVSATYQLADARRQAVEECAHEADTFTLKPKLSPSETAVMRAFADRLRALLPAAPRSGP